VKQIKINKFAKNSAIKINGLTVLWLSKPLVRKVDDIDLITPIRHVDPWQSGFRSHSLINKLSESDISQEFAKRYNFIGSWMLEDKI
jgi:hypothetical protein